MNKREEYNNKLGNYLLLDLLVKNKLSKNLSERDFNRITKYLNNHNIYLLQILKPTK